MTPRENEAMKHGSACICESVSGDNWRCPVHGNGIEPGPRDTPDRGDAPLTISTLACGVAVLENALIHGTRVDLTKGELAAVVEVLRAPITPSIPEERDTEAVVDGGRVGDPDKLADRLRSLAEHTWETSRILSKAPTEAEVMAAAGIAALANLLEDAAATLAAVQGEVVAWMVEARERFADGWGPWLMQGQGPTADEAKARALAHTCRVTCGMDVRLVELVDRLPLLAALRAPVSRMDERDAEVKRLQAIIERDRSDVAKILSAYRKARHAHEWLWDGRGSYEWDDDRYREEFGRALAAVDAAIQEPMEKITRDLTDCPPTTAEVNAARAIPRAAPPADGARDEKGAVEVGGSSVTPSALLHALRDAEKRLLRYAALWEFHPTQKQNLTEEAMAVHDAHVRLRTQPAESEVAPIAPADGEAVVDGGLLPCPFCGCEGSVSEMDGAWIAGCDSGQTRLDDDVTCRANGLGFYHRTREGAVAAWNRRTVPTSFKWELIRLATPEDIAPAPRRTPR